MLFSQAEPFDQFNNRATLGPFLCNNFEFEPVVQEITYEDSSYLKLCQPLFRRSKIICAIVVEGILRNISVKLFLNLDQWFRRRPHLKRFLI